jgi:hypothetical protein
MVAHAIERPTIPPDVRALIRTLSQANRLWGAPRIHGELLKLGVDLMCRKLPSTRTLVVCPGRSRLASLNGLQVSRVPTPRFTRGRRPAAARSRPQKSAPIAFSVMTAL